MRPSFRKILLLGSVCFCLFDPAGAVERKLRRQKSLGASNSRTHGGSTRAYIHSSLGCAEGHLTKVITEAECRKAAQYLGTPFGTENLSKEDESSWPKGCYFMPDMSKMWWNSGHGRHCGDRKPCVCWADLNPESLQVCRSFSEWGHAMVDGSNLTTLCIPGDDYYVALNSNPKTRKSLEVSDKEFFKTNAGKPCIYFSWDRSMLASNPYSLNYFKEYERSSISLSLNHPMVMKYTVSYSSGVRRGASSMTGRKQASSHTSGSHSSSTQTKSSSVSIHAEATVSGGIFGIGLSATAGAGSEQTSSQSATQGSSNSATAIDESSTQETSSLEIERRRSVTTEYYLLPGHSLYRFDVHVTYKDQNWKVGMPLFEMRKTPVMTDDAEKMEEQRQAILAPPNVPFWFGVQPDFLTGAKNDDSIIICESRGYCAEEYAAYQNAEQEYGAIGHGEGDILMPVNDFKAKWARDHGKNLDVPADRDAAQKAYMEMQYNHEHQSILKDYYRSQFRLIDCCSNLGSIAECFEKSPTFCGSTMLSSQKEMAGEHESKVASLFWGLNTTKRSACEQILLGERIKSLARGTKLQKGISKDKYNGQVEHERQLKLFRKERKQKT